MITTLKELKEVLNIEKKLYHKERIENLKNAIKSYPSLETWKYIKLLRITGYFYYKRKKNVIYSILYLWFCRRKNQKGRKLGIELNERTFDSGLEIYHTQGIVVNGLCDVGKNCKLHGNNCIGNNGFTLECPKIGNNVRLGVGAKVIGNVILADNITVAAGAVVVKSCLEEGVTLAGVPAKIIKNNK